MRSLAVRLIAPKYSYNQDNEMHISQTTNAINAFSLTLRVNSIFVQVIHSTVSQVTL